MRLIPLKEVRNRVCYSPAHIYRLEKAGQFPKRVRLGPGRIGWLESDINDWIASKLDR